jgi:hypothetical protein
LILAALIAFAAMMPVQSNAQTPAPRATQSSDDEVGNVAIIQGNATATRNGVSRRLNVQDPVFMGDLLRTGANASLSITFDDETTFNLFANATITVDKFVYQADAKNNSALFKIARGTVAFAAHQIAKTGDMKIATPTSTLGIRGTSGVVEVPDGPTPGSTGEVAVKLYADEDGRVGRIELFGARGGPRLGLLTQAATGFAVRPGGAPGRFTAVALTISPLQAQRDRGFVQRTFAARSVGRQMSIQRRNLRNPGQQQQPGLRQPNPRQPNLRQPGLNQPGLQPGLRQPGLPRPAAVPPSQPLPRQQTAPATPGQPALRSAPNLQRNLNLQRLPTAPVPRQPARRKPPENEPPR